MQYSVISRNAGLDGRITAIGPNAILRLRSGAVPASCATADSGTVLATLNLPSTWMNPAAGGAKTKAGTWEDIEADADGVIGHFRIYSADGTCHIQGNVAKTGGSADMIIDNTNAASGQYVSVASFTITAGNA